MDNIGNSTIINAIEKLDRKIDKIEEKLEKLRDKILNPKIFFIALTILVSTISWLSVTSIDLQNDIVVHGIKIDNNASKINELMTNNHDIIYKDHYESADYENYSEKLTKAQYQIVKDFLDVKRKEQIPLKVFILYDLKFNDVDTAAMFVLRKMDEL